MEYSPERALELLRIGAGTPDARFHDGQEEAIRGVMEGTGRLLVVQRTGWGKSFVYFIATMLLREAGFGPTLLVSPLLALMRNQILAAGRMGVRACTIHSGNADEWESVEASLARNEADLLLISPERLANARFQEQVLSRVGGNVGLLVIDEAHCVSDWGHDFRPHYRLIERVVRNLPRNVRVLATTATANDRVIADLQGVFGDTMQVLRGDLGRPSLTLQTIPLPSQAGRLAWLAGRIPELEGSGIVYTLTVRDAELVAAWLRSRGLAAEAYTGETGERREELERALLGNDVKVLVATTALGMGYDKPDLAFVIHYQMPGSVVAYYQQVGRAGRGIDHAYGVLLGGAEDDDINDFFIRSAFPTPAEVEALLHVLEAAPDGLTSSELMDRLNLGKGRIDRALSLLALESPSPVAKLGPKWRLTAASVSPSFWERSERLTALRREEHRQMREYLGLPFGSHMGYLVSALDGEAGTVPPPAAAPLPSEVDEALVREAVRFLRRTNIPVEPRQQWPPGGLPRFGVRGRIPAGLQANAGRAMSVWGDEGWGRLVRTGKYLDGRLSDTLVEAAARTVESWNPQPAPAWVTCIPSLRHPLLVPDFAARLANRLGLPFHPAILKTEARPEQKTMANGIRQAKNIDGSLTLWANAIPSGPVLLVDDMVDSRWTFTVAAWLLRQRGSGEVWPLALSQTGHD